MDGPDFVVHYILGSVRDGNPNNPYTKIVTHVGTNYHYWLNSFHPKLFYDRTPCRLTINC